MEPQSYFVLPIDELRDKFGETVVAMITEIIQALPAKSKKQAKFWHEFIVSFKEVCIIQEIDLNEFASIESQNGIIWFINMDQEILGSLSPFPSD